MLAHVLVKIEMYQLHLSIQHIKNGITKHV